MPRQRKIIWSDLVREELGDPEAESSSPQNPTADSPNMSTNGRNANNTETQQRINDVYYLNPHDHSGLKLVNAEFTGSNFYAWSRAVRRALAGRNKLPFVDGTLPQPPLNDPNYNAWIQADFMVFSWIMNCISTEISKFFILKDNAHQLLSILRQRFDCCNGPKIYKLKKDLAGFVQGNQSIMLYYNNLTATWDELELLLPPPSCVCNAGTIISSYHESEKLMQFLLGLSDAYDTVRSQILLHDPLPTVSWAYNMVQQDEDQKKVTSGHTPSISHNSCFSKLYSLTPITLVL